MCDAEATHVLFVMHSEHIRLLLRYSTLNLSVWVKAQWNLDNRFVSDCEVPVYLHTGLEIANTATQHQNDAVSLHPKKHTRKSLIAAADEKYPQCLQNAHQDSRA